MRVLSAIRASLCGLGLKTRDTTGIENPDASAISESFTISISTVCYSFEII
jgi:hypothetical protein